MHIPLALLDRSLRLVDQLADTEEPAAVPHMLLPGLARLIGCDLVTYNEIGSRPGQVRYFEDPAGALNPATQPVFAAYVHEHPLISHYQRTGDTQPVKISDFLDRRHFHALGLYTEFFRGIPVEHQIAVTLSYPGESLVGIAFNRVRCDFTELERDLLASLRAPLVAGLRRAQARRDARLALAAAGTGVASAAGTCMPRTGVASGAGTGGAGTGGAAAMPPARMPPTGMPGLTEREAGILELVAKGHTNVAIGHLLDVSPRTVAKHLERIYGKLGVHNRAAAVARAAPARERAYEPE